MGQSYSVTYKLVPRTTEKKVVDRINNFIKKDTRSTYNFDECNDRNNIDELMKLFIPKRAYTKIDEYEYFGEFDATYGWGYLMIDMFKDLIPVLADGSFIEMYPDNGCEKWEIDDEIVRHSSTEVEEWELDDCENF